MNKSIITNKIMETIAKKTNLLIQNTIYKFVYYRNIKQIFFFFRFTKEKNQ